MLLVAAAISLPSAPVFSLQPNVHDGGSHEQASPIGRRAKANATDLCALGVALLITVDRVIVLVGKRADHVESVRRALCLGDKLLALNTSEEAQIDATGRDSPAATASRAARDTERKSDSSPTAMLSTGEIRVAHAHQRAARVCLDGGFRACLIAEDDLVAVGERLHHRWQASAAGIPSSWNMIYLGRCHDRNCTRRTRLVGDLHWVAPDEGTGWGWAPKCLHSYLLSRNGARLFLDAFRACPTCPADWVQPAIVARGGVLIVSPSIFTQSSHYRLLHDSQTLPLMGRVLSDVTVNESGRGRPVFVPECGKKSERSLFDGSVFSSVAPAVGTQGYSVSAAAGRALELASDQMTLDAAAHRMTECAALQERSATMEAYSAAPAAVWQPSLGALDSRVHACALLSALPLGSSQCSTTQDALEQLQTPSWSDSSPTELQQRMRCPVRMGGPGANSRAEEGAPAIVLRSQCISEAAGYVEPVWRRLEAEGDTVVGQVDRPRAVFSFESGEWLKPATCAMLSTKLMDPQARQERPRLVKHVNLRTGVEFRPMLKAASTFFAALLPCLQVSSPPPPPPPPFPCDAPLWHSSEPLLLLLPF